MRSERRRVSLTGAERRALRRIEDALDADDPVLSSLLDGSDQPGRLIEPVLWTGAAVSALLLLFGVAIADDALQSVGFILLVSAIAAVVAWTGRAARDRRR